MMFKKIRDGPLKKKSIYYTLVLLLVVVLLAVTWAQMSLAANQLGLDQSVPASLFSIEVVAVLIAALAAFYLGLAVGRKSISVVALTLAIVSLFSVSIIGYGLFASTVLLGIFAVGLIRSIWCAEDLLSEPLHHLARRNYTFSIILISTFAGVSMISSPVDVWLVATLLLVVVAGVLVASRLNAIPRGTTDVNFAAI
jgi:hypothetical protein